MYPCYKVVNGKGALSANYAFGGIEKQKQRIERDGIEVINYKIDLEKYQMKWKKRDTMKVFNIFGL